MKTLTHAAQGDSAAMEQIALVLSFKWVVTVLKILSSYLTMIFLPAGFVVVSFSDC